MRTILTALVASAFAAGAEPGFIVGVCTHFQQGKGILETNLDLIRQAGARSIRDEASWGGVERVKGEYAMPEAWDRYVDRAAALGIEPLIVLDYGNRFYDNGDKPLSPEAVEGFVRYAEFVTRRFRGKVRLYEVWNEWDIGIGRTTPGDAESYVRLLRAVYPRLKKIDPGIVVMGGAMTSGGIRKGWLERMMRPGSVGALDAVSIHSYNYSGQGRARTPEAWLEFAQGAADTVRKANGGRDLPLYVTEMGWPTHTGARGTAPSLSADYLARMFLLGRTLPSLRGIWWYDFQDDGWKPDYNENNFGTVRPDGTPKPSYWALASVSQLAAEAEFLGRLDAGDPDLWALRFRTRDGAEALALWSASDEEKRVVLSAPGAAGKVRLAEAGRPEVERHWGARDWAENGRAELAPGRLGLTVGAAPWLVRGIPPGVKVAR